MRALRLLCPLLLSLLAVTAPAADQPNFVVVVADDLGYGDLACYGEPVIQTPNLDRFAREGLRLTNCYAAAANCSPSRAALMTGRTPTRLGVQNWIPMLSPVHLRASEITIASLLQRSGYDTALIGKWHLNGMFNLPGQPQPNDQGFAYWFSTQNVALPNHHKPYNFVRNGIPLGPLEGYSAQIVAADAIRWLRAVRDQARPFFLYVCFHEPHEPIATDPRFSARYLPDEDASRAAFRGNVTQLDDGFGQLMRALDELGLRENTLVLFTSDNGAAITAFHPHGSVGPLRAKKGHLYEGGIRVPGLIRWPGHITPGAVSDEPVSGVDLLPTLCAAADIAPPADRKLDGVSLLPLFAGEPLTRRTPLYWHFNRALSPPKVALRLGDYKILAGLDVVNPPPNDLTYEDQHDLKTAEPASFELYNLRTDIAEAHDLTTEQPERLHAMRETLEKLYHEVREEAPIWPAWKFANYDGPRIEWPPEAKLPGRKKAK